MKKLLIILLLFAGLGTSAQTIKYDYQPYHTNLDTFDIATSDTSWSFATTAQYAVSCQVYWKSLTGTLDGVLKMQATVDNVNWEDMNMDTQTMTAASGSVLFHIPRNTATDYYAVRLYFDRENISGGKIISSWIFNKTK